MFRFINTNLSLEASKISVLLGIPLLYVSDKSTCCHDLEEESRSFQQILEHHRTLYETYKHKWDWSNLNSRIPTVSWPLNIPDEKDISYLKFDHKFCRSEHTTYCQELSFKIASFLLLQPDVEDQKEGLRIVQELAENGNPDGMCALAKCYNDGRAGLEINPKIATSWWMTACDKYEHVQSLYEMGVAFYVGEGVPENEKTAVEYFRRAADSGHPGACYMLGDCLLDGIGVERDRGEALEWLVTSAELGHRGARSRVLAVLDMETLKPSFAGFTDSSRQSLATDREKKKNDNQNSSIYDHGKRRDGLEMQYSNKPVNVEHRYTIGGGAKNPYVFKRREAIVKESRLEE